MARRTRRANQQCPDCGAWLLALAEYRACPECGATFVYQHGAEYGEFVLVPSGYFPFSADDIEALDGAMEVDE